MIGNKRNNLRAARRRHMRRAPSIDNLGAASESSPLVVHRGQSWLERLRLSVWFFALEVVVIFAGVVGVWLAWNEARETRNFRQTVEVPLFEESMREISEASEERILQIFNFASSRETAPLARRLAIEHLVTRGHSLQGVDLSCAALGRTEEFSLIDGTTRTRCVSAPELHDIDFSKANLSSANFSDADILFSIFDGANLSGAQFFDANWAEARFEGAWAWEGLVPPELSNRIDVCIYDSEIHKLPHDAYSERPEVC